MSKVYCVFKREFIGESFDGYPMYDSDLVKCFKKKESAEKYCEQFSEEVDEDNEELYYIVEIEAE